MQFSINTVARQFFLIVMLAAACVSSLTAQGQEQTENETEVTIIKKLNGNGYGHLSHREANPVIDEMTFKELLTKKENAFLKNLNVDFSAQTLLVVTVQGDCFVRSSVKITRDDAAKKYLCRVTKIYGGCRAAGTFRTWLVIEKIPSEYTIEFIAMKPIEEGQRRD